MMATPDASQYNPAPAYIRSLLERAGVSQTEAAGLLGITNRTMRRYVADVHTGSHSPAPYTVQFALECLGDWSLGDYDNGETGCPKCGRSRLCICPNGKHRCEKCNWSPELSVYVPDTD